MFCNNSIQLEPVSYFAQAQNNLAQAQTQLTNSVGDIGGGVNQTISTIQTVFNFQKAKMQTSVALALLNSELKMNKEILLTI